MGEYAIRKSDGVEIKIGTCESMYYLRFEDRDKVRGLKGSVNPASDEDAGHLIFRPPFPDEDGVLPGEYNDYNRGERLYMLPDCLSCNGTKKLHGDDCPRCHGDGHEHAVEFSDPETAKDPGIIQTHHACGLLLNIQCYHGLRFPDTGRDIGACWNGKRWFTELTGLRAIMEDGKLVVRPVVSCRFCHQAWRYQWKEVIEYIPEPLRSRLQVYM